MRIWIDTEFNEYKGDLISMALVTEDGQEWYEVTNCPEPGAWVAEHVMPILGKAPVSIADLQDSMQRFLLQFDAVHLVADWPDDIKYFCDALIISPGHRLDTPPLTMEIRRDLDVVSALPHNALEDARAIMRKHLELENAPK